jgi:hypothetical protein
MGVGVSVGIMGVGVSVGIMGVGVSVGIMGVGVSVGIMGVAPQDIRISGNTSITSTVFFICFSFEKDCLKDLFIETVKVHSWPP